MERVIVIGVATAVEAVVGGVGAVADGPMRTDTEEQAENISFFCRQHACPDTGCM